MLRQKALGIVFANMHDASLPSITRGRTMASVPFAGRYRLIDFQLSEMTNAGIDTIGIVVKENYQSLVDHLGNGRDWDLARKQGGLTVFPPHSNLQNTKVYHGRVEALHNVLGYLEYNRQELVVLCDCDVVSSVDLEEVIRFHTERQADVTMVYLRAANTGSEGTVSLDMAADGRVEAIRIDDPAQGEHNLSMNLFVMSRTKLIEMVKDSYSRGRTQFERDVLAPQLRDLRVYGWQYTGYASRITGIRSYFAANMALLEPENLAALFHRKVYTRVRDVAPTRYAMDCRVVNCLLADGCLLEGDVENSILFRGVRIGKGATVRNCILMQNTVVEEGATLEYVIADKNVVIGSGRSIGGSPDYPVSVDKGAHV